MLHLEWVRSIPIFLGASCIAVLVLVFLTVDLSGTNGANYSDTWIPQSENAESGFALNSPQPQNSVTASGPWQSAQMAVEDEGTANIGFAAGGAQDIENFRKNIENDYLPLHTDMTYEGLFYDYYFDTGANQRCGKLFCPSYSYAVSQDPLSGKDEYYLSVGLNSGIRESDFERKRLNLVIVLDVSGSMESTFDRYHYDRFGRQHALPDDPAEDFAKSKIKVAAESIAGLVDHLDEDDRLGVVLFESSAHTAKPLESMGSADLERLKENILNIYADGGTNMEAGIMLGTSLFDDVAEPDQDEYENRIIFLTDAMPNTGQTHEGGLFGMIEKNAQKNIHTTVIGIGVDFNTELIEHITKVKGANYYSVHSSASFQQRMTDEFEFMVTPLVFDLVLSLESDGYEIEHVYGSPEADEATGEIMRVNTLFPSKAQDGKTKGGIVLLKLEKTSDEATVELKTSYLDRTGRTDGETVTVSLESPDSDFYENSGIRKGILLARYAELLKTWAFDERASYGSNQEPRPTFFYDEGIHVPDHVGDSPGRWERQSIPLQVSGDYGEIMRQFGDYFKEEMVQVDDLDLLQEVMILDKLEEHSAGSVQSR